MSHIKSQTLAVLWLLVSALPLVVEMSFAQTLELETNTPIRFTVDSVAGSRYTVGRFERVSDNKLFYTSAINDPSDIAHGRSISISSIHRLEIYGRGRGHGRMGLAIGALAGGLLGVAAAGVCFDNCPEFDRSHRNALGLGGAAVIGALGYFIGTKVRTHRWVLWQF